MVVAWLALTFGQVLVVPRAEGQVPAAGAVVQSAGTLVQTKVHSSALEGNLLGDSPERNVTIYLPPGYAATSKRYPVVYLLHGYMGTNADWTNGDWANVPKILDRLMAAGKIQEMIVVMPDGSNKFLGGFYTNSATTGNWEDFVAQDLVKYVDEQYRTVARASSRGIAGHSMGGYGSLKLGMKHPEIFGAIYGLSACCMEWGVDLSPANPGWDKTLDFRGADDFVAAHKFLDSLKSDQEQFFVAFFPLVFTAMSVAWSPDPERPPFFADFPVEGRGASRKPVEAVQAQWSANLIVPMTSQYRSNLRRLRGMAFDVGEQDENAHIFAGARNFDKLLSQNKISHEFEIYQGNHGNKIGERLEAKVFPFFSRVLQ
jgi:S-formylglutathione hydrolase